MKNTQSNGSTRNTHTAQVVEQPQVQVVAELEHKLLIAYHEGMSSHVGVRMELMSIYSTTPSSIKRQAVW